MGRPWLSTKSTRAPLEVCQCCIGSRACAGRAASASTSATSQVVTGFPTNARTVLLLITGHQSLFTRASLHVPRPLRGRRRALAFQGLRVEMRDRQGILDIVLARDLAYLLGCHLAQLLQLQVYRLVRDAADLQRADLARLHHHRIALVHLRCNGLGLRALELV